jgi:hypothetical protein
MPVMVALVQLVHHSGHCTPAQHSVEKGTLLAGNGDGGTPAAAIQW